jgi:anti-anti-sigma factor
VENQRDCLPPIDLIIRTRSGAVEVVVRGDVDAATVDSLTLALEAAEGASNLVVDLSATTFIDLDGVRALARCANRRRGRGLGLLVLGPPPSGESILRMAPFCREICWEPRAVANAERTQQ